MKIDQRIFYSYLEYMQVKYLLNNFSSISERYELNSIKRYVICFS